MATKKEIQRSARRVERGVHAAQRRDQLAWMKAVLGLHRDIYAETADALGMDPLHVLSAMYTTLELPE